MAVIKNPWIKCSTEQEIDRVEYQSISDDLILNFVDTVKLQYNRIYHKQLFSKKASDWRMSQDVFWHVMLREITSRFHGSLQNLANQLNVSSYLLKQMMAYEKHGIHLSFKAGNEILKIHKTIYKEYYIEPSHIGTSELIHWNWSQFVTEVINHGQDPVFVVMNLLNVDRDDLVEIVKVGNVERLSFEQAFKLLELYLGVRQGREIVAT